MANRRTEEPVEPSRDPADNPDRLEPAQPDGPQPTNPADNPNER